MTRPSWHWLLGPIVIAMAGCASSGPTLSSAVDRLEDSSFALERTSEQRAVRQDARELSEEARDFRQTLIHYRRERLDVGKAFADLSHSYHELRDEVERSRDRETEHYFDPVTEAYLDVERQIDRGTRVARE